MATDDLLRLLTPDRPAPIYPLPPPRQGITRNVIGARGRVIAALRAHGAMTTDELVEATHVVRSTVRWALLAVGATLGRDNLWRLA